MGSVSPIAKLMGVLDWNSAHQSRGRFERLRHGLEFFLGTPYQLGALGEGPGAFDDHPIVRADAFDCVTFVETQIALMHAESWADFLFHLRRLRYRNAHVDYLYRHHFMSSDWNPCNRALGYVSDITSRDPHSACAHAWIDKPRWLKKQAPELYARAQGLQGVHAYLSYWPWSFCVTDQGALCPRWYALLPEVSLVEIVRPNWDLTEQIGTHLNVAHLGFLLKTDGGGLDFCHASSVAGCVVRVEFVGYLRAQSRRIPDGGVHVQALAQL